MSATTRDRILETIAQMRLASVVELSRQLHTTVANIRYHLDSLLAEQLIEAVPPAAYRPRRGRPARRYRLSVKSRPADLAGLASDLLSLLVTADQTAEERRQSLTQIAEKRCKMASITGAPVLQLNQTVDFLNQHGYQARWEAHRSGPEIRLENCPFAAILPTHPELCQVDCRMLEELLQAAATPIHCYDPAKGIPVACTFALQFTRS